MGGRSGVVALLALAVGLHDISAGLQAGRPHLEEAAADAEDPLTGSEIPHILLVLEGLLKRLVLTVVFGVARSRQILLHIALDLRNALPRPGHIGQVIRTQADPRAAQGRKRLGLAVEHVVLKQGRCTGVPLRFRAAGLLQGRLFVDLLRGRCHLRIGRVGRQASGGSSRETGHLSDSRRGIQQFRNGRVVLSDHRLVKEGRTLLLACSAGLRADLLQGLCRLQIGQVAPPGGLRLTLVPLHGRGDTGPLHQLHGIKGGVAQVIAAVPLDIGGQRHRLLLQQLGPGVPRLGVLHAAAGHDPGQGVFQGPEEAVRPGHGLVVLPVVVQVVHRPLVLALERIQLAADRAAHIGGSLLDAAPGPGEQTGLLLLLLLLLG